MKGSSTVNHLKSILALPFVVLLVIPGIIHYATKEVAFTALNELNSNLRFSIAGLLLVTGFSLFIKSIDLFIRIGKGTLAPWDPTKKLVVKSLYRHMRNPMIAGVMCILLAEGLLLPNVFILLWAILFLSINHFYFVLKEEPDLYNRFGEEYGEYKQNVPRWIPRLKGWRPEDN